MYPGGTGDGGDGTTHDATFRGAPAALRTSREVEAGLGESRHVGWLPNILKYRPLSTGRSRKPPVDKWADYRNS